MGFGIAICAVIDISFTAQKMANYDLFSFDFWLISNVMHSVIVIAVGLAEILWIYRDKLCCVVPEDSMCDVWCNQLCCGELPEDIEESKSDNLQTPMILQDSVNSLNLTHTINTRDLMPTMIEPSLQSNGLSVVEDIRNRKDSLLFTPG